MSILRATAPRAGVVKFTSCPLRRTTRKDPAAWIPNSGPGGPTVRAFGRRDGSKPQEYFQRHLLGMTQAHLARYWLKQKMTHGLTPPKGVGSDRLAVKYVKKYPGAFAILPIDVARRSGLRVLLTY